MPRSVFATQLRRFLGCFMDGREMHAARVCNLLSLSCYTQDLRGQRRRSGSENRRLGPEQPPTCSRESTELCVPAP